MGAGVADGSAALPEPAGAVTNGLGRCAGRLALCVPLGPQRGGEFGGARRDDRLDASEPSIGLGCGVAGAIVGVPQRREDCVALLGDRDDVAQQLASPLGIIETGLSVGLDRPGVAQLPEDVLEWAQPGVAICFAGGQLGGVGGAEVGTVSGEDRDPLLSRVVDRVGDQVGGVGIPAAGHADVGGRRAGVLTNGQVRCGGRFALHAVHGAGVAELDMLAHVVGGQDALAAVARDSHRPVAVHAGDGPGVAVGDLDAGVVAAGDDPITGTDA